MVSCSKNETVILTVPNQLKTFEFEVDLAEVSNGDSIRIIQSKSNIYMESPFIKPIEGKNIVKFKFFDIPNWEATIQMKSDGKIVDSKSEIVK